MKLLLLCMMMVASALARNRYDDWNRWDGEDDWQADRWGGYRHHGGDDHYGEYELECGYGFVVEHGQCVCPGDLRDHYGACVCEGDNTHQVGIYCECNDGFVLGYAGCGCPIGQFDDGSGYCACPKNEEKYEHRCECKSGFHSNHDTGACECTYPFIDNGFESCVCPQGYIVTGGFGGYGCECPAGSHDGGYGACVCDEGLVWTAGDDYSGHCDCPSDQINLQGKCVARPQHFTGVGWMTDPKTDKWGEEDHYEDSYGGSPGYVRRSERQHKGPGGYRGERLSDARAGLGGTSPTPSSSSPSRPIDLNQDPNAPLETTDTSTPITSI